MERLKLPEKSKESEARLLVKIQRNGQSETVVIEKVPPIGKLAIPLGIIPVASPLEHWLRPEAPVINFGEIQKALAKKFGVEPEQIISITYWDQKP